MKNVILKNVHLLQLHMLAGEICTLLEVQSGVTQHDSKGHKWAPGGAFDNLALCNI